jgi:transcription factor S
MGKIMFCDKCGRMLEIKAIDDEKAIAQCSCGFSKEVKSAHIFSEKMHKKEIGEGVISENDSMKPGFKHKCKKCGYGECDIYSMGAPYGDESDIVFYKCKKCKYVERYAQGSSNN